MTTPILPDDAPPAVEGAFHRAVESPGVALGEAPPTAEPVLGRGLSHRAAVLAMVAITLMWSTAGVVSRQLESAAGFEVNFWRSAFNAAALVVALPLVLGPRRFAAGLRAPTWELALATACWSVMYTAFMVAMTMTTVANVLVTLATGPFLTTLAARLALGHRIPRRTLAAIVAAGAGITWMYAREVGGGDSANVRGMLVALAVPVAGATNWTLIQHNQRARRVDLLPAVLLGAVVSAVATLPWSLPFQATPADLGWLGLLGVVQLAIPCALVTVVARHLSAPEAALLSLLEVLFGVTWAWLGADEVPSRHVLYGGTLVLVALVGNELAALRGGGRRG